MFRCLLAHPTAAKRECRGAEALQWPLLPEPDRMEASRHCLDQPNIETGERSRGDPHFVTCGVAEQILLAPEMSALRRASLGLGNCRVKRSGVDGTGLLCPARPSGAGGEDVWDRSAPRFPGRWPGRQGGGSANAVRGRE